MTLFPNEAKLIELLRTLPKGLQDEVVDFASFKASRAGLFNDDDLASIAADIERMSRDPEVLREVGEIERDFAPALADGLEDV